MNGNIKVKFGKLETTRMVMTVQELRWKWWVKPDNSSAIRSQNSCCYICSLAKNAKKIHSNCPAITKTILNSNCTINYKFIVFSHTLKQVVHKMHFIIL